MDELTQKENVINLMRSSKSEQDWNDNCDKVKEANGGFPDWWYETIVLSGIAFQTSVTWK